MYDQRQKAMVRARRPARPHQTRQSAGAFSRIAVAACGAWCWVLFRSRLALVRSLRHSWVCMFCVIVGLASVFSLFAACALRCELTVLWS